MAKIDDLLEEYGRSHKHPTNKLVHWLCVPAIVLSLLGLIWCIPVPEWMMQITAGSFNLNWAFFFIVFALTYYFYLSFALAAGMLVVTGIFLATGYLLANQIPLPLYATCLIIFTVAWTGQLIGHKIEGQKPSFLKDVQFLLIGPVWLLSFIYRKLGIRYSNR